MNRGRDEGRREGRDEGRREGRAEGQRGMLLDLLAARFGVLPDAVAARVQAAPLTDLARWAKRLLSAATLEDVLADS
jgi:predicted transposase YdaD